MGWLGIPTTNGSSSNSRDLGKEGFSSTDIIVWISATEIERFMSAQWTKRGKRLSRARGGGQLAAWARSDGMGPAGWNAGQRKEKQGENPLSRSAVYQHCRARTPNYKVTELENLQHFFLHIIWQIQSQTWKFHRVLMCFFPVKVSPSFCGNQPGSCEEKNNKRKVEKREHIFKQK